VYNLPILRELILLLHWILVTINDFLEAQGLGYSWTWGLAIIGLTVIVRLILFPLTWKQYKSAQEMQVIQPQLKELQKKYRSDRAKLQEETMKLYQEHHVNPFASCLPLLVQLPVFISLYAAIKGLGPVSSAAYAASVQALNQAPFLWIEHLGSPDPTYILLVVYVVTQLISTELMLATQSDPTQKWIMRSMPIFFVLFLFNFPAGLFVYWVTTNIWTVGQQLVIRRTMPKPEVLAARAKAKPKKRSRFMEAMLASQAEAVRQREEKAAKQRGAGGAKQAGAKQAGAKRPAGGAKRPAGGAKKAPPGKGKRRSAAAGGRPSAKGGKPRPKTRSADAPPSAKRLPARPRDAETTDDSGRAADE
jgi:YidC/Oxa1 family membrane protein insertase